MGDVVFAGVTLAFFALCTAYVGACDRIVRLDEGPRPATDRRNAREVTS